MTKTNRILIAIAVVLAVCVVILLFFLFRKKPVEWTPKNSLVPVTPPVVTDSSDLQPLMEALDFSLTYLGKLDPQTPMVFGPHCFTAQQVIQSLEDFKSKLSQYGLTRAFFRYIRENYTFYRSGAGEVLFTGYYEALLKGSLQKKGNYRYPLYKKPDDLVRIDLSQFSIYQKYKDLPRILRGRLLDDNQVIPYYSREEIDIRQKLAGKDLEIVWIDNPVDVFFLQIQGSGIVEMEDGKKIRVNYADSNGHAYRAIGRLLLQKGVLTRENISMQSIRQYLDQHPDQMHEIFNYNPSYVFFREVEEGPIGSLGVPVTPYRSLALDKRFFPKGALCYIETQLPVFNENGEIKEWKPHMGFVLNQDTGGAIRTPRRADLFTGHGKESELVAGHLKSEGTFYFLIKKTQ